MKPLLIGFMTFSFLAFIGVANADEFDSTSSPEVVKKSFTAMAHHEHPYEIGKASLRLVVDCQATEGAAKGAIATEVAEIESAIKAVATRLELGEQNDFWGFDLDLKTGTDSDTPVSNQFDGKKNKFFWTNRCSGRQSAVPVRAKDVWSASKTITIWFPNKEKILNELPILINNLEGRSNKARDGVRIETLSGSKSKFDLDVTKSVKDAIWKELEETAEERANDKVEADFATVQYDQTWPGPRFFRRDSTTDLPFLTVKKEADGWVGRCTDSKSFTIFSKQSSDTESDAGLLTKQKTYNVPTGAETKTGLFGTLSIVITQECKKNKTEAENPVKKVASAIIPQLREINSERNTETDSLDLKNAVGDDYNPLQEYTQIGPDNKRVRYYFNPCTLETHEVTEMPKVQAGKAEQRLTIVSSDLDALTALRESLKVDFAREIDDPNELKVDISWSATAKIAVLESLGSELDCQAVRKFLERGSDFQCDASSFAFACLSQEPQVMPRFSRGLQPQPAGDVEGMSKSLMDIEATERGVKTFTGTYTIMYTVRKVLIDDRR